MNMDQALQIATVAMGLLVMALSLALVVRFLMVPRTLSRSIALNLLGELVLSAGATIFSALQLTGLVQHITPTTASIIRLAMFSAMLVALVHMAYIIWRYDFRR